MACNAPYPAYRSPLRDPEGGTYKLSTKPTEDCSIRLDLPCSVCPGCRADQRLAWSIRAYQEFQMHDRSSFLTLTYRDEDLPDDGKISVDVMQKFIKRVRKKHDVRYFACGEYGDQFGRPHYHALIFGTDFKISHNVYFGDDNYTNAELERLWPFGNVLASPVNMATCCYVAGYVNKKQGDEDTFRLSSRVPPIGRLWFDKYADDIYRTGHVVIEGKRLPVPPQYFEWADDSHRGPCLPNPRLEALKAERAQVARSASARVAKHVYGRFNRSVNQIARNKLKGGSL